MKCTRCGSENVQFGTNTSGGGFSAGKGCCGYILMGPLGLLCGACGSKTKTDEFWVCQKCGNKFTAKEAQAAQQRILNAKSNILNQEKDTDNSITSYTIVIKEICYQNKLSTIKTIREITNCGLKEACDIIDALPSNVKVCDTKEECEYIKSRLEAEGATVEIIEPNA